MQAYFSETPSRYYSMFLHFIILIHVFLFFSTFLYPHASTWQEVILSMLVADSFFM